MKINLVKWVNILEAIGHDEDMLKAFLKFYKKLKIASWSNPNDIFKTFNSADIVKCEAQNRIVFNVGGNKYRLVTGYFFGNKIINLYVKFVGSDKEYDKIKVCTVNMFEK